MVDSFSAVIKWVRLARKALKLLNKSVYQDTVDVQIISQVLFWISANILQQLEDGEIIVTILRTSCFGTRLMLHEGIDGRRWYITGIFIYLRCRWPDHWNYMAPHVSQDEWDRSFILERESRVESIKSIFTPD